MGAKVTEMLVGASVDHWSCSLSLHGHSTSGFICFIRSEPDNEREKNGERMWNLCVKTLLHELFTQTDFDVNSAVEIRSVVFSSVNIQRAEFGPAAEFAVEAVRVWSSRSLTGEFMLALYCVTRFSPHCGENVGLHQSTWVQEVTLPEIEERVVFRNSC